MKQQNPPFSVTTFFVSPWGGGLVMLLLTLLVCGGVFFAPGRPVLSSSSTDVATLFAFWRAFGFQELRGGNLALWNPTILCGYPFFGNFQSALLYPLNWHYLFLPLDKAINLDFAIHLFLSGWFTFLWARFRGQSAIAANLAGALVLLGATTWLRVYAGHLGPLAVLAWVPLLFLAVEGWMRAQSTLQDTSATESGARRSGLKWILIGTAAVAMQILAGYPQNVFYCAVAVALYVGFGMLWSTPETPIGSRARLRVIGGIALMYIGSAFLTAIQLGAGLAAAGESVRGGGVAYRIAATMSFAPENLITLVAPYFFGDMKSFPYWGSGYLWEMSLSFGITGLLLAVCGLWSAAPRTRNALLLTIGVLLLLALGRFTSLYYYIYTYLPGFGSFRGSAKFIFFITLFLAVFAGHGFDALRAEPSRAKSIAIIAGVLTLLLLGSAILLRSGAGGSAWSGFVLYIAKTRDIYYEAANYRNAEFARDAALYAAKTLFIAAGIAFSMTLALAAIRRWPRVLILAALLAVGEAWYFTRATTASFDFGILQRKEKAQFFASHPGDHRVLQLGFSNDAMLYRIRDIAGYDPTSLKRYAEFIAWTQGENPDEADAYISFRKYHPLFQMLRAQFFVQPTDAKGAYADVQFADKFSFGQLPPAMPRLSFVDEYSVVRGGTPKATRDAAFAAMAKKDFNPRRKVILESEPNPKPQKSNGGAPGQVRIIDGSTDHLTIIARVPRPMILLVTDAYSKNWKAWSLTDATQREYSVLPANYVLRAIPLQAGDHMIRMEYSPPAFHIGKWTSVLSLLAFAGLVFYAWRDKSVKPKAPKEESTQVAE